MIFIKGFLDNNKDKKYFKGSKYLLSDNLNINIIFFMINIIVEERPWLSGVRFELVPQNT